MCADITLNGHVVEFVAQLRRVMPKGVVLAHTHMDYLDRMASAECPDPGLTTGCLCIIDIPATLKVNNLEYEYDGRTYHVKGR